MIYCPKCGKEFEDDAKFCNICGVKLSQEEAPEQVAEAQASDGQPAAEEATEATTEEAPAAEGEVPIPVAWPQQEATAEEAAKKPFPKKLLIWLGAGLAALILIIVLIASLVGGDKENSYILYLKDDEMFYSEVGKIKPWQVTDDMLDGDKSYASEMIYGVAGLYPSLSADGNILFYPDKSSDENALYFRYVNKPKKDAVKIDSDIEKYIVNEKANTVIYLKGDGSLYTHNLKDKEKIASDIQAFAASPDGKIIYYVSEEDSNLYIKQNKKDAEKIESNVEKIEFISEDFKTIYYTKEESLYSKKAGKDKEKLLSDIHSIYEIYEDGSFYFTKDETEEVKYSAYVEDDMKDADAAMVEPVYPTYPTYPDYPFSWNYATTEEYNAAMDNYNAECERLDTEYDAAVEAYNAKIDEWYAKENRDEIREYMETETATLYKYALYYYTGKEEKLICDASSSITAAEEKAVVTYCSVSAGEVKKQKISELEYYWDIEVPSSSSEGTRYVAIKEAATEIDAKDGLHFALNDEGTRLYYLNNENEEKNTAELYEIVISGNSVKAPALLDSDVSSDEGFGVFGENVYYFKSYNDEKGSGDLYKNKNLVDYDVSSDYFGVLDEDGDTAYYLTEVNSEKERGTLKICKKKSEKIADDVHFCYPLPNGELIYISDYSDEYNKGTLYKYDDKAKKVDDDVTAIFPVLSTEDLETMYSIYYETFYQSTADEDVSLF